MPKKQKDPEKAARAKEKKERKALEAAMKESQGLVDLGRALIEPPDPKTAPNYGKAIEKFDEAIEKFPGNYEAWVLKGHSNKEQKNYQAAIEDYTNCISIKEDCVQALEGRASCYELLGRWDDAIQDYGEVIKVNPAGDHAYNMRANARLMKRAPGLRLRRDDFEKVENDFHAAIRCNENNFLAHCNLGRAYDEDGKYEEAMKEFTIALRLKDDYLYAAYRRGCAALSLVERQRDEAAQVADASLAIIAAAHSAVPSVVGAGANAANGLKKQQASSAAASASDAAALEALEKQIEARLLAEQERAKREQEMRRLLQGAVADFTRLINPEDLSHELPSLVHRGSCYCLMGEKDKAKADFNEANKCLSAVPANEFAESMFSGTPGPVLREVIKVRLAVLDPPKKEE